MKTALKETLAPGERRRQEILSLAVDIASAEGLEGLTIGRLAGELGMSKSGLFGHFGSKEDLQLATVTRARDVFIQEILIPAEQRSRGLERLLSYLQRWLRYIERSVFRGGCFFAAAGLEFDSRPGRVRSLIAELSRNWLQLLADEIEEARSRGEIQASADPAQVAFEVHGLVQEANWAFRLLDDPDSFRRAESAIRNRLGAAATDQGAAVIAERRNP